MSNKGRFGLGALGGLLPVLVSLLATDIASIFDHRDVLTTGIYVGYILRLAVLLMLGGTIAALNTQVDHPLSLVQLGIAAPALITSYINGSSISSATKFSTIFSSAYAAEFVNTKDHPHYNNVVVVGGFFADVGRGFSTNLDTVGREQQRQSDSVLPDLSLQAPIIVDPGSPLQNAPVDPMTITPDRPLSPSPPFR